MSSFFLFLCALLTLTSIIEAKGTKPPVNFRCDSLDKPNPIDLVIETGSESFAGSDGPIRFLFRDSNGVLCTASDLNNPGNDRERNSIDQYILCCPEDFAKANASLSLLLLRHQPGYKGAVNDWFIERIEMRSKSLLLFDYRLHAWTNPGKTLMFGVSKLKSSRSNNGTPSYTIIRL